MILYNIIIILYSRWVQYGYIIIIMRIFNFDWNYDFYEIKKITHTFMAYNIKTVVISANNIVLKM